MNNVETKGRGDSPLFCFTGNLSSIPRSEERVQGTVFPAGVWAAAQRNSISKKGDVVSEQNAKHSAIETGSS